MQETPVSVSPNSAAVAAVRILTSSFMRYDTTRPRHTLRRDTRPELARRRARTGNVLFASLLLLALVATMLAGLLDSTVDTSNVAVQRVDRYEGKRAAGSVNRMAAQTLWTGYESTITAGGSIRVSDLRDYLDALGIVNQAGVTPVPIEYAAALGLPQNGDGELVLGDAVVESVRVHREDDARQTMLFVTATAQTSKNGNDIRETFTDVFSFEAPPWDGLDFALLANNINCIMCHTHVDDARRVYPGGDLVDDDGVRRARIGSIESFQIRHDPDSTIAGTLYLGGDAVDENGDPISDWSAFSLQGADLDADGSVAADAFGDMIWNDLNPADAVSPAPFENLYTNYLDLPEAVDGELPDTFPVPFLDDGGVDPVTRVETPGGASNRIVDDNEFATATENFTGAITGGAVGVSPPGNVVGTATSAGLLELGTQPGLGSVTAGNVILTGTDLDPIQIDGKVAIDGDLIISGPIEGEGSLWVRGNIYIRGDLEYNDAVVAGERQFGLASNGQPNALGLTAGGNVVMGDPYRAAWGEGPAVDGTESGSWNFTLEQAAIFNRREWIKTQPTLPGESEYVQTGTEWVDEEQFQAVESIVMDDVTEKQPTGNMIPQDVWDWVQVGTEMVPEMETVVIPPTKPPPYGTSTTVEQPTGNMIESPIMEYQVVDTIMVAEMETVVVGQTPRTVTNYVPYDPPQILSVEKPIMEWVTPQHANPDYMGSDFTPRYYALGEGDPVPIQNADGYFDPDKDLWIAPERVEDWSDPSLTLADPSDPADPYLYPAAGTNAVIETIEPTDSWIDPDVLRGLITDTLDARNGSESLKIDATVYSANSIFGVVPNSPDEGTNGELRVQGALLAADVGLLGPGGTEILYDPRGKLVLDIRDEASLGLRLVGTLPAPLQ